MNVTEICTHECLLRHTKRVQIYTVSDSPVALKALGFYTCASTMMYYCKQALTQMATYNKVNLMWAPGPKGIELNEKADSLSKHGAKTPFLGGNPVCQKAT